MKDWIRTSVTKELTKAIAEKTVEKVEDEDGMDDWIKIHFTDGSLLSIRYDWIYEWELRDATSTPTASPATKAVE